MVKTPVNHGKEWKPTDEAMLRRLAQGNTATGLTAHELGRTEGAIYQHASEMDVTLKPVNQNPYTRQKRG